MEKYIILLMQDPEPSLFKPPFYITELDQICLCEPENGALILFDSIDEADEYREEYAIDGQIIEIPFY